MKKYARGAALAATLATITGLGIAAAPTATAHVPSHTVDCATGVTLTGTNYDARVTNTWSITVNGVTTGGTFGSSLSQNVPVPQGGVTSTWAVTIDAPGTAYDYAKSGTVGPCGTPPPPPPPPPPVNPPPVTPEPRHARVHPHVIDHCSCYRDKVWLTADLDKVRIKTAHPSKLLWVFTVTGKAAPNGAPYLLPNKVNGDSGWEQTQVYRLKTTNAVCPCHERGDCPQGYIPPTPPCRGKDC